MTQENIPFLSECKQATNTNVNASFLNISRIRSMNISIFETITQGEKKSIGNDQKCI